MPPPLRHAPAQQEYKPTPFVDAVDETTPAAANLSGANANNTVMPLEQATEGLTVLASRPSLPHDARRDHHRLGEFRDDPERDMCAAWCAHWPGSVSA